MCVLISEKIHTYDTMVDTHEQWLHWPHTLQQIMQMYLMQVIHKPHIYVGNSNERCMCVTLQQIMQMYLMWGACVSIYNK